MSTLTQARPFVRAVGDEPLPGYRLVAPLGQGGFGEVWKCLAPGGLQKAVKFVYEEDKVGDTTTLQQEHEGFERVKAIRHPFLLTLERVELIGGELIMVMELADKNLTNRFQECQDDGLPGIPRDELLSYMVDTAEALDVLGRQHGLQHLDVKPANLFLVGGHVKVGDYGLVSRYQRSADRDNQNLGRGLTPKYVAPEILRGRIDARSDQYPLALVYQELLTGTFPYHGKTARQLLNQHSSAEPDVSPLPAADRLTVRRALAKDPEGRFSSCLAFVKALLRDPASTITPSPVATITPSQISRTLPSGSSWTGASVNPADNAVNFPASNHTSSATDNISVTQKNHLTITLRSGSSPISGGVPDDLNTVCPGYLFLSEVENGPRGRIIRAADPDGRPYRIQIVRVEGTPHQDLEPLLATLEIEDHHLKQTVMVPHSRSVFFVMPDDMPGLHLHDLKSSEPHALQPMPREVLAARFAAVAETLDRLHKKLGFAHGLLTPQCVVSYEASAGKSHTGVAGYGIAELLKKTRDDFGWIASEPYAAPEAAQGHILLASDQYSLALMFLEQLGAWSPATRRPGRNSRGLAAPKVDLTALRANERNAIRKAMSMRPADRFETCVEFVQALQSANTGNVILDEVQSIVSVAKLSGEMPPAGIQPPAPAVFTKNIVNAASLLASEIANAKACTTRPTDGQSVLRFPARLTTELIQLKLASFKNQWCYDVMQWNANTFALRPQAPVANPSGASGVIKLSKPSGVEIIVQFSNVQETAQMGEVIVTGRLIGTDVHEKAMEQLTSTLEKFRRAIQNTDERRRAPRTTADLPVALYPIDDELNVSPLVLGRTLDVSRTGLAITLHNEPTGTHYYLTFPTIRELADWAVLAQVVRTQTVGGQHHLGMKFVHIG